MIFFAQTAESKLPQNRIIQPEICERQSRLQRFVGALRRSAGTARHRAGYMARFVYWTIRHRSTQHVRWVLEYEGCSWNPGELRSIAENDQHA